MQKIYVMSNSHRKMRGFEYLVYSAFSCSLLTVLVLLPLAPLFASELENETLSQISENLDIQATDDFPNTEVGNIATNDFSNTEVENVVTNDAETTFATNGTDFILNDSKTEHVETVVQTDEIQDEHTPVSVEVSPIVEDTTMENTPPLESVNGDVFESVENENSEASQTSNTDLLPEVPIDDISNNLVTEIHSQEIDSLDDSLTDETSTVTEEINTVTTEEINTVTEVISTSTTHDTVATTTVISVNTVTNDENRFSFAKSECTIVGEGTFYCARKNVVNKEVSNTDRVFSALDETGDKEIYIEKDGYISQITDNVYEDDAPQYDALSNSIVWQRLIEGRYQIISYDVETSKEVQITSDRYNNMEPQRSGDAIVWQGWVGNDWEIFLLERDELTMITDNTVQDITPSISSDYIVWQSFEFDTWKMKVYDVRTKSLETIEDANGGSIENPRFVLVYDSKLDSGDVETRGYDLKSGEVIPLTAQPVPVPSEIPDPDQTGEKRALVSPPVQPKTKTETNVDDDQNSVDNPPVSEDDLVILPMTSSTTVAVIDTNTLSTTTESQSYSDVVIPAVASTTHDATAHIEDLVIEPFMQVTVPISHSQEDVASST